VPTQHDGLVELIARSAADSSLSFDAKSKLIGEFVADLSDRGLIELLAASGFIPESYHHDSSEEKVYAKAMDHLVAEALRRVGFDAAVGTERANAADVEAERLTDKSESLVLDAKAFRVSRTALNPKDYKISALSGWRGNRRFACLVGPIAGFPEGRSRLYEEAVSYNVTLLTFSHLAFMLEHKPDPAAPLSALWSASELVEEHAAVDATVYWAEIDQIFCAALGVEVSLWADRRREYFHTLVEVADKEIAYYESEKLRIRKLPRKELEDLAIAAMKLDGRIGAIAARKAKTLELLSDVERLEQTD
jgi:hypothetical protein